VRIIRPQPILDFEDAIPFGLERHSATVGLRRGPVDVLMQELPVDPVVGVGPDLDERIDIFLKFIPFRFDLFVGAFRLFHDRYELVLLLRVRVVDDGALFLPLSKRQHAHSENQARRGRDRPWLLAADDAFQADFVRQQIRLQMGLLEALQGQAVGHAEGHDVFREGRRGGDRFAGGAGQLLELADFQLQFLLQELLQARQAEGVAQADHILNLGVAVRVREVAERALDLADEIVEHLLQ
jgi:hypothetical protein